MSKILVTGGCGFVGINLVNRLLHDGHQVIVIDDLSSGHKQSLNNNAIFVDGSIENDDALSKCFNYKPEYLVHLAALFANQNSVDHPSRDLFVNGFGTIKILEWACKSRVKKVLYSSSSCVYGNKSMMIESDKDLQPDTPYAITKLLGENYVKFWSTYTN